MWILTILPEFAIHLIFTAGVITTLAGFVFGFIPLISRYKFPIQVVGILVLTLGVYLEGGLADYKEWQLKIAEMEAKVKAAEIESARINTIIEEKVVTKTEVVKERGRDIIKYIDRVVTKEIPKEVPGPEREKIVEVIKFVENCPVPQLIIEQHNAAAEMNKAAQKPEKDKKMKYLIILLTVLFAGCTVVPVKMEFPRAVPELMKKCQDLQKIEDGKNSITDMLKTVVNNYALYYECSNRVEGWQEWYHQQKKIFETVK